MIDKREKIRIRVYNSDIKIICDSKHCTTEVTEQYMLDVINALQVKHADIAEKRLIYGTLGSVRTVPVMGMFPQIARAGYEILTYPLTDTDFNDVSDLYAQDIQSENFRVYCKKCAEEIRDT